MKITKERINSLIKTNHTNYKKQASKIVEVFLEDCQIYSRNNYFSIDRNPYKEVQMMDSVFNPGFVKKTKKIETQMLIYEKDNNLYYSSEISISKDNLKIKLFLHKKTYIYVKNYNTKDYFFDLDFLKD